MRRVTLRVRHVDSTYSLEGTGCCCRVIPGTNVLSLCRGRIWLTLAIMSAATFLSMATLMFACYAVVSESVRHRNSGVKSTLLGPQYSGSNVLDLQSPSSNKHRSLKTMDNIGYVNAVVRDGHSRNSISIKTRVDHYGFTPGHRNTANILLNLNSSVSKLLSRTYPNSASAVDVHSEKTGVNVPSTRSFHDGTFSAETKNSSNQTYSTKYAILDAGSKALRKLPQAIIIGVKKGGTRALLEFIRLHPDVRAPGPETHFFDRFYHKGFEWYRRKMPPTIAGQITIEKTPSYFVTKEVPRRIYDMSKDVKLIVVVRDPVTRAISDYTQAHTKRPETKPFEQMAFLENSTGVIDTSWGAIRIGVYAKHLERWLKYFPLKQMHFVNGEKMITDPAGEIAKVQSFLGLKCIVTEKHFYFNESKGFPCLKKHEGSSKPHCLGKTKGRTHPRIEEKAIRRLRDFFHPFNIKFSQMVRQDFGWPG